ncbi:HNH endonuclease [Nocardia sp. NPDC052001]|uniref:HNH endonuclease n=1 Tax=Nocardia sp. NPDC052001 TaxID=3154853 RepID=UPI003436B185
MSIAPTVDTPSWVAARAAAWNQLVESRLAQFNPFNTASGGGRVHNYSVESGADAVRQLTRINHANDLGLAVAGAPIIVAPIDQPITTTPPVTTTPAVPTIPAVPNPPKPQTQDQPTVAAQPNTVPAPPAQTNPQALEQEAQNAKIQRANIQPTTPPLESPSPVQPGVTVKNVDPLAFPDTSGHEVGSSWDVVVPKTGLTYKYTIPPGNGRNTVDIVVVVTATQVVTNTARVAAVEGGPGYVRWQDDPNGFSSFFSTADWRRGGWGLNFAPGMSTSGFGRPFEVGPNWEWVKSGSYDASGKLVGYDLGVRNWTGLYDNTHSDLLGNQILTRATRYTSGISSDFVGFLDKDGRGKILDEYGRWADRFLDGNHKEVIVSTDPKTGKQTVSYSGGKNTYDSEGSWLGHLDIGPNGQVTGGWSKDAWYSRQQREYHLDPSNQLREAIVDPITGLRGDITHEAGHTRISYSNGTVLVLDWEGKPVDTRSRAEKSRQAALNFGKGALHSFLGLAEGFGALTGVNDALNQAAPLWGYDLNLTTRLEAFKQLDLSIGSKLYADLTTVVGTIDGGYKSITGQQSWGKTWDTTWHAALNSLNENSKLLSGTDWTGFSNHPAETLGTATIGIGSLLLPTKGLGRAGRTGAGAAASVAKPGMLDATNAAVGIRANYALTESATSNPARIMADVMRNIRIRSSAVREQFGAVTGREWGRLNVEGRLPAISWPTRETVTRARSTVDFRIDAAVEGIIDVLRGGRAGFHPAVAGGFADFHAGASSGNWLDGKFLKPNEPGQGVGVRSMDVIRNWIATRFDSSASSGGVPPAHSTPGSASPRSPQNHGAYSARDEPYSARAMRQWLEDRFGSANVTSTTVPEADGRMVHMAGRKHPRTGIPYDFRGFPIFDHVAPFDTRLPLAPFRAESYAGQMRMASRDLSAAIVRGELDGGLFDAVQLGQIHSGAEKISGFTWHHHQDVGRMQLVPTKYHGKSGHIGGEGMSHGR